MFSEVPESYFELSEFLSFVSKILLGFLSLSQVLAYMEVPVSSFPEEEREVA